MKCIFCDIVSGAAPSKTLYENEHVQVFQNIHPQAPFHALVIPKEHLESISQLRDSHCSMVGELILAAQRIAAGAGLKGYKLVFNVGREGGQVIDHLHLHVLGGWQKGDGHSVEV
ncbi:MAG: HIT domain-containing protein [Candidatus Sungbacteria bacterium]|nr:HIT domain-containing protein [Candidatus Sungbacteria bacterium]